MRSLYEDSWGRELETCYAKDVGEAFFRLTSQAATERVFVMVRAEIKKLFLSLMKRSISKGEVRGKIKCRDQLGNHSKYLQIVWRLY